MKKARNYTIIAAGTILLSLGLYFMTTTDGPQASIAALPYVCIGIGSGVLGYGISKVFSDKIIQKNPVMQKQMEINDNDERNKMISNRAKARAYDLMIFVFAALMLVFTLMGVDVMPVLLFVFAYLFVQGYAIYCRCKYEREM